MQNTGQGDLEGEEEEEEQEEVTVLNEVGSFEKVVIWNHESIIEGDDAFVKGLREWIAFAEAVSHVSRQNLRRLLTRPVEQMHAPGEEKMS